MTNQIVIYKIVSPSGKIYIGQTRDAYKRFWSHKNKLTSYHLGNSIKKYGSESHEFIIVHELPRDVEQSVVNTYEQYYMDLYRSAGIELMNMREAGSIGRHSEESIIKIKEKRAKQIHPLLGKPRSEETKRKLSIANLGKKKSEAEKEKLRGRPSGNKGKKASPETIEKLRQSHLGHVHTEVSNSKRKDTMTKYWATLNIADRKKRNTGRKNTNQSEETRLKISEGLKRYFQSKKI